MVTAKSIISCLCWPVLAAAAQKAVYAHFMVSSARYMLAYYFTYEASDKQVGIVENYTVDDWKLDIAQAQAIGIDGFALNCAPPRVDSYTPKQLANAYQAAAATGFKVFISFDFAYWGDNDRNDIIAILQNYSSNAGQAYYNGGALVSTFVGDYFNWNAVKSSMGGQKLTVIPMIQDPNYLSYQTTGIDGGLSWYAWPTDGGNSVNPAPMTTIWDDRYLQAKGNLAYMARKLIQVQSNIINHLQSRSVRSDLGIYKRSRHGSLPTSTPKIGPLSVKINQRDDGSRCWR